MAKVARLAVICIDTMVMVMLADHADAYVTCGTLATDLSPCLDYVRMGELSFPIGIRLPYKTRRRRTSLLYKEVIMMNTKFPSLRLTTSLVLPRHPGDDGTGPLEPHHQSAMRNNLGGALRWAKPKVRPCLALWLTQRDHNFRTLHRPPPPHPIQPPDPVNQNSTAQLPKAYIEEFILSTKNAGRTKPSPHDFDTMRIHLIESFNIKLNRTMTLL
ncbi:hypothetical protein RND71_021775 [Anisodus tanguticus]|uniref:Uncharacterized protein n=1 Tax=Anisodus tanguticus TaxID=243964 RepID=A0AAE1VD93_9SOLA|nr:hypothetical protein RND71_021775 [Anisodus tanguticus]